MTSAPFNAHALTHILPELVLIVTTLVLLLLGLFRGEHGYRRVMLISTIALASVLVMVCATPPARTTIFHGAFVSDTFSIFMKAIVLMTALIVLIISRKSLASEDIAQYEYPVLILFAVTGMMLMISANDFISVFMGLELQSLSLYVLTTLRRDHLKASEAGIKYFVLGALSTGLLLYGCSFIYGYLGTTNFDMVAHLLKNTSDPQLPILFGLAFVCAGLVFKISAVPFHMWTPDVYEGAPTSVTTFLASAPKIAGFALITRVFVVPFSSLLDHWQVLLTAIAIASMLLGAFGALRQQDIKRFLAYSAIGNMGYALIGIIVGNEEGVTASILYIVLYLIMILGVFACLLNSIRRSKEMNTLDDIKGLARIYPGTAFILSFLLFSMAGIPPLAGFLGKLYIFKVAVAQGFYTLAIVGVLASVVAAAYYLWIVKTILMDDPDSTRWAPYHQGYHRGYRREPAMTVVLLGAVVGLIWIFLAPSPIITVANNAASSLFGF